MVYTLPAQVANPAGRSAGHASLSLQLAAPEAAPPANHTWRSTYQAVGRRMAMRVQDGTTGANQVHYLFADHLASSNVSYRSDGGQTVTQRYYPWGTVRPGPGNALPTGYTYTGQLDSGVGLMYYGARFYDPQLGRFAQPDTIVPEPGDPQALNRYSYVLNNPLRYTDPTGMFTEDAIWTYILDHECSGSTECTSKMYSQWQSNTQWWNALLSASANDLLMTVNPFIETMSFFTFQGEGQTLLTGMVATTNPFAIEHGSSDVGSVALSSIYNGGLGGVLPVAIANKDFRGTFTHMHGINDYSPRLRTIDSQLADGYNILWNVFVATALLPVAPGSPAALVLVELGGAIGAEKAYSAFTGTMAVKEGDQVLMVSYGGPYGAVFAEVSGRYDATYGWYVRWHNPNGSQ